MKTNLRILLIGVICLTLGVVIGFFAAGRITKKRIHQKVEFQKPPKFKERLEEKLSLTPEQQVTFNDVFNKHMNRMREMDQTMFQKRRVEFDTLFSELKLGLDEKQVKKVERFENRLKERKHRRRPPHPPQRRE
ncbi:MAG: hypothetical protein KC517_04905 [Bacteroidetes bacterium]|jgi:hypothetical protein|nr:hypothetical protein [Bacteroidota bacterium]